MSRVIVVDHCADCPHNERNWTTLDTYEDLCKVKRRAISISGNDSFPTWCPLPEKEEKCGQ